MELAFSSEEIVFRDEVRAFIAQKLPESARKNGGRWPHWSKDDVVNWQRIPVSYTHLTLPTKA